MKFFNDVVYGTTLDEMDECYHRCKKCECNNCFHTCRYYTHLADTDERDERAAWCTKPKGQKWT